MMSQSIYLVRIDTYDRNGELLSAAEGSRMGIGFSGLSTVVMCATFWIVIVAVATMGRRMLRVRIPFAASSSLVISATSHAPKSEVDPHLEKVQWGVVRQRMFEEQEHWTLSSQDVDKPRVGRRYL